MDRFQFFIGSSEFCVRTLQEMHKMNAQLGGIRPYILSPKLKTESQ